MIKMTIPLDSKILSSELIKNWVDRVNQGTTVGELNPEFGQYGTALHYLRISNILDSNICLQYHSAAVAKKGIDVQVTFTGEYADRLLELQVQNKITYKPRGIVVEVPSLNIQQPQIVTFDVYVDDKLLNRNSKESLKAEADHWLLTAKQEAKIWRDFFS